MLLSALSFAQYFTMLYVIVALWIEFIVSNPTSQTISLLASSLDLVRTFMILYLRLFTSSSAFVTLIPACRIVFLHFNK